MDLFLAALGLCCREGVFAGYGVCGPLPEAATLFRSVGLGTGPGGCVPWAQLLLATWGLLGSGIEPMSPALAGGFFTIEPPGKPLKNFKLVLKILMPFPGIKVFQMAYAIDVLFVSYCFPGGSDGKEFTCSVEDSGLIPGLGRSHGEGNGNQYSYLENSMDRGAWWATVHGVSKSPTRLTD